MDQKEKTKRVFAKQARYASRRVDQFLSLPLEWKVIYLSVAYLVVSLLAFLVAWQFEARFVSSSVQTKTVIDDIKSGPAYMRDLLDGDTVKKCPVSTLALIVLGLCGGIGWSFFTAFLISLHNRREENVRDGSSRYAPDWTDHGVILGWGPMGGEAVRQLRNDFACNDVVVLSDRPAPRVREELLAVFSENGVDLPEWLTLYKGDCCVESNLRDLALERARQLLYIGDWECDATAHDSRAVCVLTLIARLASTRATPLPCHVCIRSAGLYNQLCIKDLPEADAKVVDFQPFNPSVNWARKLWSVFTPEKRLYPALTWRPLTPGSVVQLFIIGFGDMGQALAAQAAKVMHYPAGVRVRVTVIDPLADVLRDAFLAYLPVDRLTPFDMVFEFVAARAEEPAVRKRMLNALSDARTQVTIAVCVPQPDVALEIVTRFSNEVKDAGAPVLLRQSLPLVAEGSILSSMLLEKLCIFGAQTDCGLDASLDKLAIAAHEVFLDTVRKTNRYSPDTRPAHREWNRIPALKRQSNRNQTDAICERLVAWNYGWEPGEADVPIREADVEPLSLAEHQRWWAEYILAGRKLGPSDSETLHTHHCMIPYDQLDELTKGYDRSAIMNLPNLLNKEYGVRVFKKG